MPPRSDIDTVSFDKLQQQPPAEISIQQTGLGPSISSEFRVALDTGSRAVPTVDSWDDEDEDDLDEDDDAAWILADQDREQEREQDLVISERLEYLENLDHSDDDGWFYPDD